MLDNHASYKYETPYIFPLAITRCFINGTINLKYSTTKNSYNIHQNKTYKSDANVEDTNPEYLYDNVNIWLPVIYFRIILKLGNKVYTRISTETLELNHIGRAHECFHEEVVSSQQATLYVNRIGDALRKRFLTIQMLLTF